MVRDKTWGGKLTKQSVFPALIEFLAQTRFDVAVDFAMKLKDLLGWFKEQKMFKFYSSSVLLIYDAAHPFPKCLVKVVDFAHTTRSKEETLDNNFRDGLQILYMIIENISSFHKEVYYNEKKAETTWVKAIASEEGPGQFSNEDGSVSIELTDKFAWTVDKSLKNADEEGWQYAKTYKSGKWHSQCGGKDNYRRRKWTRKHKPINTNNPSSLKFEVSFLN